METSEEKQQQQQRMKASDWRVPGSKSDGPAQGRQGFFVKAAGQGDGSAGERSLLYKLDNLSLIDPELLLHRSEVG